MSTLKPIDLAFLLMENSTRRMHMNAFMLFDLPQGQRETFIPKLLAAYRNSEVAKPFNQKLKWLDKGVASWEPVEPDMNYHVRHIAIPKPGTMKQFYETISFINSHLLDRAHPLWECYIIEGIEDNRFAVMIKVHHSMIDGEGGLRVLRGYLSDSPRDKTLRAPWMPLEDSPRPKRARPASKPMEALLKRLSRLPGDLIGMGGQVMNIGAQSLNLAPRTSALPFGARRTLFNNIALSGERRYANCELSLDTVKAIAKLTETSMNDVLMAVIDDALHQYLQRKGQPTDRPLVAFMPMSLRVEGEEGGGNQVTAALIPMGQPAAKFTDRLAQVHESTQQAKAKGRKLPKTLREVYALLLVGSSTMSEFGEFFADLPSSNLVISNMKGPGEQLYLGGAMMSAFHGLPIVPPGSGLNVTFASVHQHICLGVGAAPEAVDEPFLLTQLIEQGLQTLAAQVLGRTSPARKKIATTKTTKTKEKTA